MAAQTANPSDSTVPLCVDLDGTLIKTDLLWESARLLLKRNALWLLMFPVWWARGRAHLKRQIAARAGPLNVAGLPYLEPFLDFLRAARRQGRPLILATASDSALAQQVVDHVGLFDELLASDGKTNLRGATKLRKLVERFGERGFDYAGNSPVDLAVWRGARAAIVVNCRPSLVQRAARVTTVAATFCVRDAGGKADSMASSSR